uniref:EGF-like domain-containing protein n=1 Tax=Globodera pallida TaxID=36090 RepID=A0A183C4W8_GLOPA
MRDCGAGSRKNTARDPAPAPDSTAALSAGCPFSFAADFCARTSPHGTNPCRNGGICRNVHNTHRCDCSNTAYAGPACAHTAALSAGCPFSFAADFCARTSPHGTNPCRNGGICRNVHNAHRCDCSSTAYAGPACAHKPRLVQFPLAHYAPASARLSSAAGGWHSEAEDIALTLRLSPASATASAGTGSGQLYQSRSRPTLIFVLTDQLSNVQNPVIAVDELAVGEPIGTHRLKS